MKLLMLKIGARPKGRLIEQHDVVFCAVDDFTQVIDVVNKAWQEAKNNWHIDAWREITRVGEYRIELVPNTPSDHKTDEMQSQLYFVNLGGYLPDMFEEFHYKDLVVASSVANATAQVKQSEFYKTYDLTTIDPLTGINGVSHVDDRMNVDIDEIHAVNALISDFTLKIIPLSDSEKLTVPQDTLHIGYLSKKKIRNYFANE